MRKRNPMSPWNPSISPDLTPQEYEKQVVAWLRAASGKLERFEVQHLDHLRGPGGDYEFDAVVEFTIFEGARLVVLVECKRYSKPVEREKLLSLWAKLQDVKANKAMIFATCGFQSGALEYAKAYGIATVAFVEGNFLYETRAASSTPVRPPSWAELPQYAGIFMSSEGGEIKCNPIDQDHTKVLSEWLAS